MTLPRMRVAALAVGALLAPTALAQPADIHQPLIDAVVEAQKQDSQEAARPDTAGNPNVSGSAAPALAQERYYASYGTPTSLSHTTRTVAADTDDGIAPLPFGLAVVAALIVGLAAGSGLHILYARRHPIRPAI
jgi:hypothetical protein